MNDKPSSSIIIIIIIIIIVIIIIIIIMRGMQWRAEIIGAREMANLC